MQTRVIGAGFGIGSEAADGGNMPGCENRPGAAGFSGQQTGPEECWLNWSGFEGGDVRSYALALPEKCWRSYWLSLYCLARRAGSTPQEAEDLAQSFLLDFFKRGYVDGYKPQLSTFRSFICMAFKRFMFNAWRSHRALKRGAGQHVLSLEDPPSNGCQLLGMVDQLTPEKAYERVCLCELFVRATHELAQSVAGRWDHAARIRLIPLATDGRNADGYRVLSRELHCSEAAAKMTVCRLRRKFIGILRQEITRGCHDEGEARQELHHLINILS